MGGLNVVALISGGKDSLFSVLHCQANGHQVIALANLHPPHDSESGPSEDLESYMYQTVGHAVIPLYEKALALPLYRQEITGSAVNQQKSYGPATAIDGSSEDETECLLPLLRKTLAAHPEINAVSTGAILSDYQRTRVESIALRLGLTPLSYLWQWPTLPPQTQTSLLEDMAAIGQDARIIKVASGGLDDSFLWQNVADRLTINRLSKAAERFGQIGDGAVLGEGGEYETLAIDGPAPLWKGRIVVPEGHVSSVQGEAGSASIRLRNPSFVPHDSEAQPANGVRIPLVLEPRFQVMAEDILSESKDQLEKQPPLDLAISVPKESTNCATILSGVTAPGIDAAEQARGIMDQITSDLKIQGHEASDIVYTIIVLRSMSDFAAVNAVYGSCFTKPNPPARLTIACADVLPQNALLSISTISSKARREGMHVQSRSYWAPANIGPYSQAIKISSEPAASPIAGCVYIAGQIPLTPASMELPPPSPSPQETFAHQAVLALQHLDRIGRAMKVKQWVFGIAFVTAPTEKAALSTRTKILRRAWQGFHQPQSAGKSSSDDSECEDFDVWHLTHGSSAAPWRVDNRAEEVKMSETGGSIPRLVVIQVDSLPRGSDVEWVGHGKSIPGEDSSVPLHVRSLLYAFRTRILAEEAD
ncbi:Hypothetical predicted protein [Lecanosticta acicola]|uniref:Diphthine--ammonia ligase n=1 Tax=Lecanosticta acicola TaxID=111012 RepID=A0AAI9E857_9PEZI|nr:Hypothetical predicted protein [Lecanosticta acicola]